MHLNAVAIVLATSLASVSALVVRVGPSDFPSCSLPCFTNADTGYCSPADNACLCTNNAFLRSTTDCNQNSCSPADLEATAVVARQLCDDVGVNIRTNPAAQPTSTNASAAPAAATSSNAATIDSRIEKSALISGFAVAAAVVIW